MNEHDDNAGEHDPAQEAALLAPGLIHELRHPLFGIKGGLELIAARMGEGLVRLDEWKLVEKQVQRLEELLRSWEGLLSPGHHALDVFVVDDVVEQAVELLSFRLRPLGARFAWNALPEPQTGWGAPNAVLHAVTNLLVNAVDAAQAVGDAARVQLRVLAAGRGVEVRVSDEGHGIRPELRPRLFQARFTTKERGKGTGLGLHIARTMMRKHGGGVRLVDEGDPARLPWARTEFSVDIPPGPRR